MAKVIWIPGSIGELLDKVSILNIKRVMITDTEKLAMVKDELQELMDVANPFLENKEVEEEDKDEEEQQEEDEEQQDEEVEEADEEEVEEEVETVELSEFIWKGKTYGKSPDHMVYKLNEEGDPEDEPFARFDPATNRLLRI